ncbi:hypothetical protein IT408_00960 [Candidatus Uhrbacteria bacterium]|nr:hypothetical protein [Candidatus Uhrbacteria bacterium]
MFKKYTRNIGIGFMATGLVLSPLFPFGVNTVQAAPPPLIKAITPNFVCWEAIGNQYSAKFSWSNTNNFPVLILISNLFNRITGGGLNGISHGQPSIFAANTSGNFTVNFDGSDLIWRLNTPGILNGGPISVTANISDPTKNCNPSSITVNKVVTNSIGGTKQANDFTLQVNNQTVINGEKNYFQPGTYTVSELPDAAYTGTFSGDCDEQGNISLSAGQDAVCTLTNTDKPGMITFHLDITNDNGGTATVENFSMLLDTTPMPNDVPVVIYAQSWPIYITGPSGYALDITDCPQLLPVLNGETRTCHITANDIASKVIIKKVVTNDNNGKRNASSFKARVLNNNSKTAWFNLTADEAGIEKAIVPGTFEVKEQNYSRYAKTYSEECSGTIDLGETKTCTITNDDIPGELTVIKHVAGTTEGDKTASDFTLKVTPRFGDEVTVTGNEAGEVVQLNRGRYSVNENNPDPAFETTYSNGCFGRMSLNGKRTCIVTNNKIPVEPPQTGTLVVKKVVIGGPLSAADFELSIDTTNANHITSFAGSEQGTSTIVPVGSYNVTENEDEEESSSYTVSYGENCKNVTIESGDQKECIVTNTYQYANITVTKVVNNENGGQKEISDFPLSINNGEEDPIPVTSGQAIDVAPGFYMVSEANPEEWNYTASFSDDCAGTEQQYEEQDGQSLPPGNMFLEAGKSYTCTLTNTYVEPPFVETTGTLIVVKQVVNDNGRKKDADDFTMRVNGENPTLAETQEESEARQPHYRAAAIFTEAPSELTFPGNSEGTRVVIGAGDYSVDEFTDEDYTKTLGENCSGTIAAGQTITCVITNDDTLTSGPATLIVKKELINDNGKKKTPAEFHIRVTGTEASPAEFGASSEGTVVSLMSGSYSVTEDPDADYTSSLGENCSGTILPGQTVTCIITNDDIPMTVNPGGNGGGNGGGGSGGAGGLPASSGSGATGFSEPSIPSVNSIGRVLGIEFVNTAAGACNLEEPEAGLIVINAQDIVTALGTARDTNLEQLFLTRLVSRIAPPEATDGEKSAINNFTTYGTRSNVRLGAGERAGVVDSFRAIYGHVPKSDCEWQEAIRIANSKAPSKLNPEREQAAGILFKKIYRRDADRAQEKDNKTILIMSYGIRSQIRDLNIERAAIRSFRRIFGKVPSNATEWDTMRGMAYGGLKLP